MTQLTLNLGQQTKLTVLTGDCAQLLPSLETESIQCCVTSPPYWGLRDYDHPNQIGAEPSPEQYVQNLVDIFRLVRKTLRPEGTLWLNVGDGYARNGGTGKCGPNAVVGNTKKLIQKRNCKVPEVWGLKDRDLMGLPWRVAFSLQADGWILRSKITWIKKRRCLRVSKTVPQTQLKRSFCLPNPPIIITTHKPFAKIQGQIYAIIGCLDQTQEIMAILPHFRGSLPDDVFCWARVLEMWCLIRSVDQERLGLWPMR